MKANKRCKECMLNKQIKRASTIENKTKRAEFLRRVQSILDNYSSKESAPQLSARINKEYKSIFNVEDEFKEAKEKYNAFLLSKEEEIEKKILSSETPLKECIKFVCAANYIDFSAVSNVNEDTFLSLLEKAQGEEVEEKEFDYFLNDLKNGKHLLYLTDNAGEIVIDKIFIKLIKNHFKDLEITVMVRGENTINDATIRDAEKIGLTKIVNCIGNGNGAPGTVFNMLSEEAKSLLINADVIISKGQGNFESLFKEGFDPYYMFLCKCDLFTSRFGLEKFSSVFKKESRIKPLSF